MKNKVLVNVYVVKLDEYYDMYIPLDLPIGQISGLICKMINNLTDNKFDCSKGSAIMDGTTGKFYNLDDTVSKTNIENGKKLIFF